ncbi:histidine kinase dimerization/phospho-acceptor domain-containing protein [Halovenus salina]|uniref:histidine kinase n=1 Tax=Halovenus salina TaxID=1510225 RepID=A0ABD5W2K3_9EURY
MTDQVSDGSSESHPGPNEFLFKQTADCIVEGYIEDGDPIVTRVNDAFEEVFGYTESEIRGQNLNDFVAPDGKRAEAEAVDREVRNGNIGPKEVTRQTVDGPRDFLLRAASGDKEYHYAIYTDITERKEYERALESERARLDEFASFVSHDLRNPLNVAQLRLELIRQEHDSEHVDAVDRALSRIDTLIEDLLTLAREGKRVSETEPVDLATLSSLCWKNVATGAAQLETELDCSIRADRSRLRQLVENLIRTRSNTPATT